MWYPVILHINLVSAGSMPRDTPTRASRVCNTPATTNSNLLIIIIPLLLLLVTLYQTSNHDLLSPTQSGLDLDNFNYWYLLTVVEMQLWLMSLFTHNKTLFFNNQSFNFYFSKLINLNKKYKLVCYLKIQSIHSYKLIFSSYWCFWLIFGLSFTSHNSLLYINNVQFKKLH